MSEAEFNKAYKDITGLKSKPSNEDSLELYSLAKVAQGQKNDKPRPGVFDFTGRAKWDAWKKKEDAGLTKDEAQKQYVAKFEELKSKIGMA